MVRSHALYPAGLRAEDFHISTGLWIRLLPEEVRYIVLTGS